MNMSGRLKDKRYGNCGFSPSPSDVRSNSPRIALNRLDHRPYVVTDDSWSAVDLVSNPTETVNVQRP